MTPKFSCLNHNFPMIFLGGLTLHIYIYVAWCDKGVVKHEALGLSVGVPVAYGPRHYQREQHLKQ